MRNLLSAILLLAAAALFAGDPAAPSFVGDWEFVAVRNGKEDKNWPRTVMTVSADGSCVTRAPRGADFEVVRGKWRQKGNDVWITDSDGEHRARFDEMGRLKLVTDGKGQEFLRGYEFFLRRAKKTSAHLAAGAPDAAGAMFEALGIPKDQVREAWHTPELKLRAAQWRDTKLRFESGHIGVYEVWDRELAALRALMGQPEVAVSPLMPKLRLAYLERLRRQLDMLKAEHRAGFIGTDPIREKELEISEFRKRHGLSENPPSEWKKSAQVTPPSFTDGVRTWETLISRKGCLVSAVDVKYSTEGSIFAGREWQAFFDKAKRNGVLFRFIVDRFSSERPTEIHICNFRNATEGELAVFVVQRIVNRNWYAYDGGDDELKRIAGQDAAAKVQLLKPALKNERTRAALQNYFVRAYETNPPDAAR